MLTSCYVTRYAPINPYLDPLIGKPENAAIMNFGPPTSTAPDAAGGKVLTWSSVSYNTIVTLSPNYLQSSATSYTTDAFIQVFINSEGNIYHWRTNFPGVPYKKKSILLGVLGAIILFGTFVLVFR
jgi:hypothetical protein